MRICGLWRDVATFVRIRCLLLISGSKIQVLVRPPMKSNLYGEDLHSDPMRCSRFGLTADSSPQVCCCSPWRRSARTAAPGPGAAADRRRAPGRGPGSSPTWRCARRGTDHARTGWSGGRVIAALSAAHPAEAPQWSSARPQFAPAGFQLLPSSPGLVLLLAVAPIGLQAAPGPR